MTASRHFGPFSGAQLTAIIITLILVAGFPFAAFAVTGSNTFVTDAKTGAHAGVDASGRLSVADRPDTTTAYQKALVQLGACINVVGPVQCTTIAKVSSAHGLVVTSIHLVIATDPSPGLMAALAIERSNDGSCKSTSLEEKTRQIVVPGGPGELDLPYPSGLAIPAGRALCAFTNANPSALVVFAGVYGYATAPSAVPAS